MSLVDALKRLSTIAGTMRPTEPVVESVPLRCDTDTPRHHAHFDVDHDPFPCWDFYSNFPVEQTWVDGMTGTASPVSVVNTSEMPVLQAHDLDRLISTPAQRPHPATRYAGLPEPSASANNFAASKGRDDSFGKKPPPVVSKPKRRAANREHVVILAQQLLGIDLNVPQQSARLVKRRIPQEERIESRSSSGRCRERTAANAPKPHLRRTTYRPVFETWADI